MFVHPESRGKNIASQILEELESWAKELSFSSCILKQVQKISKPLLYIKEWLS
jgi:GNAT superfamily N-acetyltransferase